MANNHIPSWNTVTGSAFDDATNNSLEIPTIKVFDEDSERFSIRTSQTDYSTVNMSPPFECLVCKIEVPESEAKYCGECGITTYCSEQCLEEDYPVHTLVCKQFELVANAKPAPPASHRIVILLPENDAKPQFTWMPLLKDAEGNELVNIKSLGQGFSSAGKSYDVSGNLSAVNGSAIRFMIDHDIILYSCKPTPSMARHNASIDLIMNRRAPTPWQGPFVIVARSKNWKQNYQHVSLSDLRFTVDFLRTFDTRGHGRNVPFDKEFVIRELYVKQSRQDVLNKGSYSRKVKAVVISCLGDRKLLAHNNYVQVEIKADHPAFDVCCTKISGAVSLPMATYILPADDAWRGTAGLGFNPYENVEVTYMHMDISAVDEYWGFANEREWDIRVGSILVVRKDKEDLSVHHVEAHAIHCSTVLKHYVGKQLDLEKALVEAGKPMNMAQKRNGRFRVIHEHMTRKAFTNFFEQVKKEKVEAGFKDWATATSPYEVPFSGDDRILLQGLRGLKLR